VTMELAKEDLVLGAPVAVLGRNRHRAEPVDGDAENSVDGTQADGVVAGSRGVSPCPCSRQTV